MPTPLLDRLLADHLLERLAALEGQVAKMYPASDEQAAPVSPLLPEQAASLISTTLRSKEGRIADLERQVTEYRDRVYALEAELQQVRVQYSIANSTAEMRRRQMEELNNRELKSPTPTLKLL